MIRFEHTQVVGLEPAIRGMRNQMNSCEKSDSVFDIRFDPEYDITFNGTTITGKYVEGDFLQYEENDCWIGPADHDLMMRLANGGPVHAKYRRMIAAYVDITAPLYWWDDCEEFGIYEVGTADSFWSTMRKISAKPFELDDFSHEQLDDRGIRHLEDLIAFLNFNRLRFLDREDKNYWWQMIQLLPSSYNQKRTVMMNYEVLHNIYVSRKDHKLDEWRVDFMDWIESLPYSELITAKEAN